MTVFDDLSRDARHAARLLRRNPGFSFVVLTILSVAIGASVAVFGIVDAWLLRPLRFPDADRIVIGLAGRPDQPAEPAVFLFYRTYLGFKERSHTLSSVSAAFRRGYLMSGRGDAASVPGMAVSGEFFDTLGVAPVLGRTLTVQDADGSPAAVLGHGLWQQQFGGSRGVIGTTVSLNGVSHEIVGVMPSDFDVRMLEQPRGAQLWTAITPGERGYDRDGMGPVAIYARLRDGVSRGTAQAELDQIQKEIEARFPEAQRLSQFPVLLTTLQDDNTRTIRATLLTVVGAVACLLLVACTNTGTLLLGRGLGRLQEAAVRTALGSGFGRLVRQFLTESLLLSMIGGAVGLGLAAAGIRLFTAWNPIGMLPATSIEIDLRVLVAACAIVGLAVIVSGLVPALRIAAIDPQQTLRGGGDRTTTGRGQRAQSMLLGSQLAVSLVLLVLTSLLVRTFITLTRAPLGFTASNLSIVDVQLPGTGMATPEERLALYDRVATRIGALPGVQSVAAGTSRPLFSGGQASIRTASDQSQAPNRMSAQDVTTNFFETLGMRIVAGRSFDSRDSSTAPRVIVVNEAAARSLFGSPDRAIGRLLYVDRQMPRQVVGVVGDTASVFFNTLEWQTNPIVYLPARQAFAEILDPTLRSFALNLHVRSSRPLSLADVKRAAAAVDSRVAVTGMETADESVATATQQPRFRMALLGWFSIMSLLLTAVGVYGLVSQVVARRSREIGIRLALGARGTIVAGLVARGALLTAAAGALTGGAAALALSTLLSGLLYGVDARDPWSFVSAAATLLAVTTLAALGPARRAARIDPIRVLRAD